MPTYGDFLKVRKALVTSRVIGFSHNNNPCNVHYLLCNALCSVCVSGFLLLREKNASSSISAPGNKLVLIVSDTYSKTQVPYLLLK